MSGSKHDKDESAGMNQVSKIVEEKQLNQERVQEAMAAIAEQDAKLAQERRARERALAKVKVAKDDITVLNAETEWGLDRSEMFLREHGGDVAAALRSFARPTAEQ